MQQGSILKAEVSDLPLIMETFLACTSELRKMGIDQWDFHYPDPTSVLNDIRDGRLYLVRNEKRCLGTITLTDEQDRQYDDVGWKFPGARVLVVKRLAVHPVVQGEGLGKRLSLFAEQFGRKHRYETIRLDTYSLNPVSNGLYRSMGYEMADGFCYFHNRLKPYYCYEKPIR